jgi:cellulose biosynthesis protein BcsQ
MTASVLCFASAKGGAGATTIAASAGTLLAGLGHTTLLIDAAPASGGLTLFYLHTLLARRSASGPQLQGVFETSFDSGISFSYAFVEPNLAVVPLSYGPYPLNDMDEQRLAVALPRLIDEASSFFDYIILDTGSVADGASEVAALLADHVIVVAECDALSFAQLEIAAIAAAGPLSRSRRWVLPNKMSPASVRAWRDAQTSERSLPPIPADPEVRQAYASRHVAIDLVQPNLFTVALLHALAGLSGFEFHSLELPQATDTAALRQEIVERYEGIAAERNALRTRFMQLSAAALRPGAFRKPAVTIALAAAVAAVLWLLAGSAIALGASSAWRALAYLLVVAGAATGMSTWYLLRKRALIGGDINDAIMELEALDERLMELGEQKQKWHTLFEYCSAA